MKTFSANQREMARFSKPAGLSPAGAARKAVLRRIQKQELRKLQALIPFMSGRSFQRQPDPCTVILNAVRYIDDLHATILARVRSGSLAPEVLDRLNLPEISVIEQVHNTRRLPNQQISIPTTPVPQMVQNLNRTVPLNQRPPVSNVYRLKKEWD